MTQNDSGVCEAARPDQSMKTSYVPSLEALPAPPPDKSGWPWTLGSPPLSDNMPDGVPWPRVTVVTPSFNQAAFLEETIRSVLLQGYLNLAYIIIDGGSSDGSVDIIRQYEPWLAYWISEKDRGQGHAINKGWSRAEGDVIAYLNSDDCYTPGAIAAAARAFHDHPEAGMVYGRAEVVDEQGSHMHTLRARPYEFKRLVVSNIIPQPSAFFSQTVLSEVGYLDEDWEMIMDYEYFVRIGRKFPAINLPETLSKFRSHEVSKTNRQQEKDALELLKFHTSFFSQKDLPSEVAALNSVALATSHYRLAAAYVRKGRKYAVKAIKPLLQSFLLSPRLVLSESYTMHIIKNAAMGFFNKTT